MTRKAGAGDPHGLVVVGRTPVLLGELREGDGRRVALDPAP
jgi:hypothetical protein